VPVWVANFVLGDYGTGAVMPCPTRPATLSSRAFNLPIRVVVTPDGRPSLPTSDGSRRRAWHLVESGEFSGLPSEDAQKKMIAAASRGIGELTIGPAEGLGISRQRYWGTPIRMIYCDKTASPCRSTSCSSCCRRSRSSAAAAPAVGTAARVRERHLSSVTARRAGTDTMDTFVDRPAFLRFADPRNAELPVDAAKVKCWLPVDFYVGGVSTRFCT
jgi:leucyl-tRNA synthetase